MDFKEFRKKYKLESKPEDNMVTKALEKLALEQDNPDSPYNAMNVGSGFMGAIKSLGPKAGAKFLNTIKEAEVINPKIKDMVHKYTPEEYNDMKLFSDDKEPFGYAIKPDGDLVSVFSGKSGKGNEIMKSAIEEGASKLDHFKDPQLDHLYSKYKFEPYKTEPNWTPGGPDVVYRAIREKHPELFKNITDLIKSKK